jgi:hypothetical protein
MMIAWKGPMKNHKGNQLSEMIEDLRAGPAQEHFADEIGVTWLVLCRG